MIRRESLAAALLLASAVQAQAPQAAPQPATIIVMDGSGSMWGQIDGRPKLEIARETVGDVLSLVPEQQQLGLIAYGHRRKGDCTDIELMVAPAAGTGSEVLAAVQRMKFLGMTPLSQAVRSAAEALRYTEQAATVVLVTDGLETCDADPCALGSELEAAGLNFTAHIIGFDLAAEEGAQLACLADNTGGRYVAAADAASLGEALQAAIAAPEPAPAPAAPPATAQLLAPDSAPAGTSINVQWEGPATEQDSITLIDTEGSAGVYDYIDETQTVRLRLPPEPGSYRLVYRQNDAVEKTLAERAIEVTESVFALTAPERVSAGAAIEIGVEAPVGHLDSIVIAKQGDRGYESYTYVDDSGRAQLTAPEQPGSYELRYRFGDRIIVARRAIQVD
jgi:Ca-activated chloride channel family protein